MAARRDGLVLEEEPGPNRVAAEVTVAAYRELGRLEPIDSSQVAAFLGLAAAVDEKPFIAGLWREYRAAEMALRLVGRDQWDEGDRLLAKFDDPPRRLET